MITVTFPRTGKLVDSNKQIRNYFIGQEASEACGYSDINEYSRNQFHYGDMKFPKGFIRNLTERYSLSSQRIRNIIRGCLKTAYHENRRFDSYYMRLKKEEECQTE